MSSELTCDSCLKTGDGHVFNDGSVFCHTCTREALQAEVDDLKAKLAEFNHPENVVVSRKAYNDSLSTILRLSLAARNLSAAHSDMVYLNTKGSQTDFMNALAKLREAING